MSPETQKVIEHQTRRALASALDDVLSAARAGFSLTAEVRAQAEPVLGLTQGLAGEVQKFNEVQGQIGNAIATLEQYQYLPQVAPIMAVLRTLQPVAAALAAQAVAKQALALLVVPDFNALAATALFGAVNQVEAQFNQAIRQFVEYVEG